jgi:hypothetical protein
MTAPPNPSPRAQAPRCGPNGGAKGVEAPPPQRGSATAPTTRRGDSRAVCGRPSAGADPSRPHTPDRASERSERTPLAVAGAPGAGAVAPLDTTAQLPTRAADAGEQLTRRARAKLQTEAILGGLIALGNSTPLHASYRRTLECAAALVQDEGKITGKYCGNRWCAVCNRVRTAKLRQAYAPTLAGWDCWFVTLTLPNVAGAQLHGEVRKLTKAVRLIADRIRRRDKLRFAAVRKVEVTFNAERRDYHPHLHFVVDGEAAARVLVQRWLDYHPAANAGAQDVRRADPETVMRELFKYLTKQTIQTDRATRRITSYPARVLDTIYRATRGLRTIQPMGFKVAKAVEEVTDADAALELDQSTAARLGYAYWEWQPSLTDWVDRSTGELLTGYTPSRSMSEILGWLRDSVMGESPP